MSIENFFISSNSSLASINDSFYGYVFADEVYHYKSNIPKNRDLFENLKCNSGVFASVFKDGSKVKVFTDPFSQYPIFYFNDGKSFCVSNSLKAVASFSQGGLNRNAVIDCLAYYSPTNNETIVQECYTTKPLSYIEIDFSSGTPSFSLVEFNLNDCHENYDQLLHRLASKFIDRAKLILTKHCPVVHLTGGLDSRLALASIMKASSSKDQFSVFCFGTEQNEDKLIFNHLCNKFSLTKGKMLINGINIDSINKLDFSSEAFKGLKYTNQQNFFTRWTPEHSEVTGYFSGGLLKGFGNYFSTSGFTPFSYTSTRSTVSKFVYNATAFRMLSEIGSYHRNYIQKENFLYISNRSKCHFGIHSVVNNMSFHSFDILYDPELVHLFNACPYPIDVKNSGAIITDLIELIAGKELAYFPLAGKTLPNYRGVSFNSSDDNCFSKCKLTKTDNDEVIQTFATFNKTYVFEQDVYYNNLTQLRALKKLPKDLDSILSTVIEDEAGLSKVEKSVVFSLIGYAQSIFNVDSR